MISLGVFSFDWDTYKHDTMKVSKLYIMFFISSINEQIEAYLFFFISAELFTKAEKQKWEKM